MLRLLEMYWATNQPEKAVDFFGSLLAHPKSTSAPTSQSTVLSNTRITKRFLHELEVSRKLPNFGENVASTRGPERLPPLLALGPLRGLAGDNRMAG